MGFVGDLLGGDSGMGFQAKKSPLVDDYVNTGQINTALDRSNGALGQQQDFITALQAQNGLANQSNVFSQQQALAGQIQDIANGNGPNPALAQLNQATGQNIAAQNALMAGQRGAGANVGLLARQSAQQGAGIQQAAVGQSAVLQAQQQLAGIQALQQQQGMLSNTASNQVSNLSGATNAYTGATQNQLGTLYNAVAQQNNAQNANIQSQNSANAAINSVTAKSQSDLFGGILGGAGAALAAHGGEIRRGYDGGGNVVAPTAPPAPISQAGSRSGPQSKVGQYLKAGGFMSSQPGTDPAYQGYSQFGQALGSGVKNLFSSQPVSTDPMQQGDQSYGDMVSAMDQAGGASTSSGGGTALGDMVAAMPMEAKGGMIGSQLKAGGKVPGKAKISGDSLKNDNVPALLSAGEIVLPRSVTQSSDPVGQAAKFVAAILAQKQRKMS